MPQNIVYADLEIRILAKQVDGYPVELTFNNEQEYSGGYLDPEILPWRSTGSLSADGQKLFKYLFAYDPLKTAWDEVRGNYSQRRIRLRIDTTAPELHTIPWELLRGTEDGGPHDLAASVATPFSRYLAGRWQPGSPILIRPIKILVAVADPENLAKHNLQPVKRDEEWALLEGSIAGLKEVKMDLLGGPCTLSAIEEKLREGYHILHFVGHGKFNDKRQKMVLYLADESNQVDPVDGQKLAAMLTRQLADVDTQRSDKLRLVFLASCQSAKSSPADAFRGMAPALVAAGVPAVLAMQDLVPIGTARKFSQTFYKQLLVY